MKYPSRVRITGPLVEHAAGFRAALESQGYRRNAVADQLRVMAHVSRWLDAEGLDVVGLSPPRIERFLQVRREAGYTLWLSAKGVAPLVGYLRNVGAVPLTEVPIAVTPVECCLATFRAYLIRRARPGRGNRRRRCT